jgi:GH25 family lysozyme M1 (1,4-beta-N-acetylmuramidase)
VSPFSPIYFPPGARSTPVPPGGLPLEAGDMGPDVASYQGYPDWQKVRQTCTFAFTKATEGTDYLNPYFSANWQDMLVLNVRGAYHFSRPHENAAQAEAAWFAANMGRVMNDDLVVLDIEAGSGDLSDWAIAWAEVVKQRLGVIPFLYSNPNFMRSHGLADAEVEAAFAGQLWLAAYQDKTPSPPPNWSHITFWQYTDSETVQGVQGLCDCSIYLG